jgi:hypothetical protein
VPNPVDADGCSLADRLALDDAIARAAAGAKNHGAFVKSMGAHLTSHVSNGVIDWSQRAAMMTCVGSSNLP